MSVGNRSLCPESAKSSMKLYKYGKNALKSAI